MKIYLAGPMTGVRHFNFELFDHYAEELRERGYEVISPAEMDSPEDRAAAMASETGIPTDVTKSWGDFLARDVKLIADGGVDGIVCLPRWWTSRGARMETFTAYLCELPVFVINKYAALMRYHIEDLLEAWQGNDPS